ncbi:hypothetical protein CEE39_07780 [bacterium (candidate division B38) B3_B38]|nr:MAG: hypothetical protein CEE39_07780 [bacterium (candidate division B38) B3_B38]
MYLPPLCLSFNSHLRAYFRLKYQLTNKKIGGELPLRLSLSPPLGLARKRAKYPSLCAQPFIS